MSRVQLVGLAGAAGSGKTAAARYLQERHGLVSLTFAGPIKDMLWAGLGLSKDQLYGPDKELPIPALGGTSPRKLWCSLEGWGRGVHPDLWIQRMDAALDRVSLYCAHSRGGGAVISDVRFESEAAWVRGRGGRMLHLRRPDLEPKSTHITERPLVRRCGDLVVPNEGTLEEVFRRLDDAIEAAQA